MKIAQSLEQLTAIPIKTIAESRIRSPAVSRGSLEPVDPKYTIARLSRNGCAMLNITTHSRGTTILAISHRIHLMSARNKASLRSWSPTLVRDSQLHNTQREGVELTGFPRNSKILE